MQNNILKSLNPEEQAEFLLRSLKWSKFGEAYFKNPDDDELPLKLEPGQIKAINALQFGYDIDSIPDGYIIKKPPKIVVMIWARQCLKEGTLIQLSDGTVKRIEEIKKFEDIVSYSDGKTVSTNGVYPQYNGIKKCLKVITESGKEIECTDNHPFLTCNSKFIEIKNLKISDEVAILDKNLEISWEKIVKIEDIGEHKTYGLRVYPYHNHITNGFITENTGKTTGVCCFAATVLCLQKGANIGVMAQSERMAKEFIGRTRTFIENSPFKSSIKKSLKMEILMDHGGYIMAHSTSESIRGMSYHYLILDEAARIKDIIIEGAAMHTTRKIGKRVIILSTPDGYGGALVRYYQQGLKTRPIICKKCFTEFTQAHFKKTNFDAIRMARGLPPCPECGHYEKDGPTKEDPDIIEGKTYFYGVGHYSVISVNPFSSSFYSKEEILEELRRRGDTPLARQELLGEIITPGKGVFRQEWIDACTDETLGNVFKRKKEYNYMIGMDFGKTHDNSAICVGHADPKTDKIILDYLRVIKSDNIEYEDIKNQLIEIVSYFKPIWIVPDATNMGEPVVEMMEKDLVKFGWQGRIYSNKDNHLGFWFDTKTKPNLIENLVEYFARNRIKIPPKYDGDLDILHNELINFSYDVTKANYVKYGVQTEHDDTVIALALMCWGHRHRPWIKLDFAFGMPRGGLL